MDKVHLILGGGNGIGQILTNLILDETLDNVLVVDKEKPQERYQSKKGRVITAQADLRDKVNWHELLESNARIKSIVLLAPACKSRDEEVNQLGFTSDFVLNIGRLYYGFLQLINFTTPLLHDECSIVVVSSVLGSRVSLSASLDYHASKAVLESIVKYMSVRLAPNVYFNCIAPGLIARDESSALLNDPKTTGQVRQSTPLSRPYSQEEVASAVWSLVELRVGAITGQIIMLDGGSSLLETFYAVRR
jgi:NAD(P)-dependent dehydrogenase (short-subunit alcohol dehydrogenase family)